MTILIIEDDDNDARLLVRALRKAGHKTDIKVLKNGETAMTYLSGQRPAPRRGKNKRVGLLILDLTLPGMTGFEFLEWLSKQESLASVPVVVFSSSPYVRDVSRAYALGARTFFLKPTDPDELNRIATLIVNYWTAASWPALPGPAALPPRVNPLADAPTNLIIPTDPSTPPDTKTT